MSPDWQQWVSPLDSWVAPLDFPFRFNSGCPLLKCPLLKCVCGGALGVTSTPEHSEHG